MLRSMTGYGRAVGRTSLGNWVVEIHSVNRKSLDMNIHMPKELLGLDIEIRQWTSAALKRGQVTVRITPEELTAFPPMEALKEIKKEWEKLARELGFAEKDISLSFLLEQWNTFSNITVDEELKNTLKSNVEEALLALTRMREREGAAIERDLRHRWKGIREAVGKIEERAPFAIERMKQKLAQKVEGYTLPDNEERILREIVLYADKLDISEEITRLYSHLQQFADLLSSEERSIGRNLDFLLQEIHREINTIGAKSAEGEIALLVVGVKAELERMREQVQNVE